jgi:hypothetical protein
MKIFPAKKKLIFKKDIGDNEVILNEIGISVAERAEVKVLALFDTGATHSAITTDLVKILKPARIGAATVIYGGTECETQEYYININFNGILIRNTIVSEMPESPLDGIDFIIGMSVIKLGDFRIRKSQARFYLPRHNTKLYYKN